jgi:hypothetical protein
MGRGLRLWGIYGVFTRFQGVSGGVQVCAFVSETAQVQNLSSCQSLGVFLEVLGVYWRCVGGVLGMHQQVEPTSGRV